MCQLSSYLLEVPIQILLSRGSTSLKITLNRVNQSVCSSWDLQQSPIERSKAEC